MHGRCAFSWPPEVFQLSAVWEFLTNRGPNVDPDPKHWGSYYKDTHKRTTDLWKQPGGRLAYLDPKTCKIIAFWASVERVGPFSYMYF